MRTSAMAGHCARIPCVQISGDPIARRRLGVLAAGGGVALVLGAAAGAGHESTPAQTAANAKQPVPGAVVTPTETEREAQKKLSPSQLAGHAVILRFAGTRPPAYVRKALRHGRAAGVILFRDNIPSPKSTRALTAALQKAGKDRTLISTDQEGGTIRNLPWAGPQSAQSTLGTVRAATAAARVASRDLAA